MGFGLETLRARLIVAVLVPALLIIAFSAALDFRTASRFAQREQDALLLRTAVAFAAYLGPESSHGNMSELIRRLHSRDTRLLSAADGDTLRFLVIDARGERLGGDSRMRPFLPTIAAGTPTRPVFLDVAINGEPNRLVGFRYASRDLDLQVLVAETGRKRDAAVRALVAAAIWPNLLLVVVMLIALGAGIERSLRRLDDLGRSIAAREATHLEPLEVGQAPYEVRPLVTAINEMLGRIAKSQQAQRTFLSGAAHQLRTPLAGIQMQIDLATAEAPPALKPRLQRIHMAIADLVHCTHQMLALARSSATASSAIDLQRLQLVDLIEDSSSTWVDIALRREIELVFRLEPAICRGSPWMLQQLLGNLIDNAIKHGPAHGVVTVSCGTDTSSGQAYMDVADEGTGIPQAAESGLLEPFVRGKDARSEGSGLGLAIVREVVDRHQARLAFSADETHGHRVRVIFPPAPPDDTYADSISRSRPG